MLRVRRPVSFRSTDGGLISLVCPGPQSHFAVTRTRSQRTTDRTPRRARSGLPGCVAIGTLGRMTTVWFHFRPHWLNGGWLRAFTIPYAEVDGVVTACSWSASTPVEVLPGMRVVRTYVRYRRWLPEGGSGTRAIDIAERGEVHIVASNSFTNMSPFVPRVVPADRTVEAAEPRPKAPSCRCRHEGPGLMAAASRRRLPSRAASQGRCLVSLSVMPLVSGPRRPGRGRHREQRRDRPRGHRRGCAGPQPGQHELRFAHGETLLRHAPATACAQVGVHLEAACASG